MFFILSFLAILFIIYADMIKCRNRNPGWSQLEGWKYAHRGLHDETKPENSMAAFQAALENGYGVELDVHLLKDGTLAVVHDSSLKRMTGFDVEVEDLTKADLKKFHLNGTEETIPTFWKVLDLFAGKAPIIVELKVARDNYAELCETACKVLDNYNGPYCIESFDPRCVSWLKKHRPDVIRGQLSSNYFKGNSTLPWLTKFVLTYNLMNHVNRPDFIAYHYGTRNTLSNWLCRYCWKNKMVSWTLRTEEEYYTAIDEGWIPIFEGFRP